MSSAAPESIDGYVADSLYPSAFHATFAPPWTDAIIRHHGLHHAGARADGGDGAASALAPRTPFTMVDLGCGDGVG